MKPFLIIAIVIPIIVAAVFAVFFVQSMPQQNFENTSEESRDEATWQLYQKTYLEQECREQFIGQPDQLEDCYDRIDEEQRLNPPTNPNESKSDCSIQCLVYDPVCGEDGITYGCGVEDAACHGIKVEYEGECIVSTNPPK
ncbi:MAG: Kazal-type serine protease inhibitor family protein [Candidatus Nitrosopumilus sp. bin_7KS]